MALISQNTLRCSKILSHLKRLFGKKQLPLSLNEEGVAKIVRQDKKAESGKLGFTFALKQYLKFEWELGLKGRLYLLLLFVASILLIFLLTLLCLKGLQNLFYNIEV